MSLCLCWESLLSYTAVFSPYLALWPCVVELLFASLICLSASLCIWFTISFMLSSVSTSCNDLVSFFTFSWVSNILSQVFTGCIRIGVLLKCFVNLFIFGCSKKKTSLILTYLLYFFLKF